MYEQYDRAVHGVLDFLVANGYSRTPKKDFRRWTRDFRDHLATSNLAYSRATAYEWLSNLEHRVPRSRFLGCRRALALVEQVLTYGYVKHTRFLYGITRTRYQVPESFNDYLESYLQRRREDGCAHSTLQMDRIACTRFLLFLEARGITRFAQLTPEVAKAYSVQEQHRTVEGKNAYIRRAKGFVRFLASNDVVPETLEYTFPVDKARRVAIVKTLSAEQIAAIDAYRKNARSPSELRNAAMALIALRLGLRSVDICNLRLPDIQWSSATISIEQRKTGRPLSLPFPAAVGNAVSEYILKGRPECDSPYVFITLKRPYRRLNCTSRCYRSSIAILGEKEAGTDTRGLHIVRKTYASELLKANTPVSLIAQALGHADETTVDEYLATDGRRMRACAIGLAGIEPTGALR